MDNDDRQIGKILSRREALALFTATGFAFLAACAGLPASQAATLSPTRADTLTATAPLPTGTLASITESTLSSTPTAATCVVRPEMTEGPYFRDEKLNRSDIRSDPSDGAVSEGIPLELIFNVTNVGANSCAPFEGAAVDVWHCDAMGVYSDVNDPSFSTVGKQFLRGYQVTGPDGVAQFTTVIPGWYRGRTVHIHFKIRAQDGSGSEYEFTSQLFFDDSVIDEIYKQAPYASKGERTVRNPDDNIFQNGGDQLTLALSENAQGYAATFDVGLQMA